MRENIANLLEAIDHAASSAPNYGALANGLKVALIFARFSANRETRLAELEAVRYIRRGQRPTFFASQRNITLDAINTVVTPDWTARLYNVARDNPAVAITRITTDIPGFRATKAAFALSLAGFARLACLDRHCCRIRGVDSVEVSRKTRTKDLRAAVAYLALCEAAYGVSDHRLEQWADFLVVPAFRDTLHITIVELILCAYGGAYVGRGV